MVFVSLNSNLSELSAQIVAEDITFTGNGYSWYNKPPKSGYTLINAYNTGRQFNTVRITDVSWDGSSGVYVLFLDQSQTQQQSAIIKLIWLKKL